MPSYNHLKTQNFSVLLLLYCLVGQLCLTVSLWAPACQSSLSFTISQSLLKLMVIESVTLPNHLILCCPLLLLSSIFPSIRVFSNESALHIRWSKYRSFSISRSNEYSGLISFRIDCFDLLVQGTLKSLLQHNAKASVLWCSVFFTVRAIVQIWSAFRKDVVSPTAKKNFNSHFYLPLLSQFYLPFTLRLHRKDCQCSLFSLSPLF